MPRCMMVKKSRKGLSLADQQRRSLPEATVAPPRYSPKPGSTSTVENAVAAIPRCKMVKKKSYQGLTLVDLPRRSPPEATVAPPRGSPEQGSTSTASTAMSRGMMVKKKSYQGQTLFDQHSEATVAPPRDSPTEESTSTEPTENAERECTPVAERSAEDLEAAQMLLSVAEGLPPPLPVVTVQQPPEVPPEVQVPRPIRTVSTNTIAQSANIYYIAQETPRPIYTVEPTVAPQPQLVNTVEPQVTYFCYRPIPEPQIKIVKTVTISIQSTVTTSMPMGIPLTVRSIESLPASSSPSPPSPQPAVFISQCGAGHVSNRRIVSYDCNECGKCYSSLSNLCRHKQIHLSLDSNEAKRCQHCGKLYVSKPALAMHLLTHRMDHVCNVCGKQFSRLWLLSGHQRSHTGERPYHCAFPRCGRAFADRSNLRAHVQTHSSLKKLKCTRCRRAFTIKNYHLKHKKISCPYCVNQRRDEDGEKCNE